MPLRLDPEDEYMHELGPEPTFNESMYFNVYDPSERVGGFLRLGNRANEGYAEMTVCLFLPDGRVAFWFDRPGIRDNSAFSAGGLRFQVIRPFEELEASYQGPVILLDDPLALSDPKAAFTGCPRAEIDVQLTFTGLAPMVGGEPEERAEPTGEEFARGHYEQLTAGIGGVTVGADQWEVDG